MALPFDIAGILTKAVVVFAATNIDDIVVLVLLFADPALRARSVVLGQFAGIAALFAIGAAAGAAAFAVPPFWISLLGLVPLSLGLYKGVKAFRRRGRGEEEEEAPRGLSGSSQILAVAGVTLANGGDNIGVYVPVFATDRHALAVYGAVFAVMTALWCLLGYALVNHRAFGKRLQRYGAIALPIVLVLLGLHILAGPWIER